jgi:hypothetical protein
MSGSLIRLEFRKPEYYVLRFFLFLAGLYDLRFAIVVPFVLSGSLDKVFEKISDEVSPSGFKILPGKHCHGRECFQT